MQGSEEFDFKFCPNSITVFKINGYENQKSANKRFLLNCWAVGIIVH